MNFIYTLWPRRRARDYSTNYIKWTTAKGVGGDVCSSIILIYGWCCMSWNLFCRTRWNSSFANRYSKSAVVDAVRWSFRLVRTTYYVVLAPKIGLSALLGLAIAGQIISSLVIDHFGLMGAVVRPVSLINWQEH